MDVALAVIAVALALGVGIAVAWPLLRRSDSVADAGSADRLERLEDQLEASLRAIREIEQDHLAGGLSDEDFETLNRDERARAVALMRRIDSLGGGAPPEAETAEGAESREEPAGGPAPPPSGERR